MHPFLIILHLASAVLLLLWSVKLVQKGVERCFGTQLRAFLRAPTGGRLGICLAGMALAVLMQSATAVALMSAGFAAAGVMTTTLGIAALIGADFGSAVVVRLLSFDLSEAVPVLVLIGAMLQLKSPNGRAGEAGRILLGCGFLLLSIQMIGQATEPLKDSTLVPKALAMLGRDPFTALVVAGLFAWALHSSVATLILLSGLALSGALPPSAALPMVIGVNLGGALVALWLTKGMPARARRIPAANLILRCLLGAAALLAMPVIETRPEFAGGTGLVNFHLAFNLALLILALPFVGVAERMAALVFPDPPATRDARPDLLQRTLIDRPTLALGAASREVLAMGDLVARMLHPVMDILDGRSKDEILQIRATEEAVNQKHTAIKLFVAEVTRSTLDPDIGRRALDVVDFAISLEHAGDLVAKTLLAVAETRRRDNLSFSPEGRAELAELHRRVESNVQLALNVIASGEVESAKLLAREKEHVRAMERQSREHHLERLQAGNPHSVDTSDLHLELLRSLKEINSLVVTAAYPILSRSGQLRASRLVEAA